MANKFHFMLSEKGLMMQESKGVIFKAEEEHGEYVVSWKREGCEHFAYYTADDVNHLITEGYWLVCPPPIEPQGGILH